MSPRESEKRRNYGIFDVAVIENLAYILKIHFKLKLSLYVLSVIVFFFEDNTEKKSQSNFDATLL